MQWSAVISRTLAGKEGKALQLCCAIFGSFGVLYGLQVLMVERAQLPVCSVATLSAAGEENFLHQQQLTVEVAGAVVEAGVWQLAVGSRVAEAIEKAGGFSQRADRTFAAKGLNLARALTDGEKIYVPFADEVVESNTSAPNSSQPGQTAGLVSINTASAKELQQLPGIGEARAAKIVENRPYLTVDELLSKEVLTETLFAEIEASLSL